MLFGGKIMEEKESPFIWAIWENTSSTPRCKQTDSRFEKHELSNEDTCIIEVHDEIKLNQFTPVQYNRVLQRLNRAVKEASMYTDWNT